MEPIEDNRKLISAATPLEVYAAIRRTRTSGTNRAGCCGRALEMLRIEAARMVQQPLNPGVLEAARQLVDRTTLRWPEALQLGAALNRPRHVSGHGDRLCLRLGGAAGSSESGGV